MDVNTAVVLLAAIVIIRFQFTSMGERLHFMTERAFSQLPKEDFTPTQLYSMAIDLFGQFMLLIAPILGVILLAGMAANYLQVGVLFTSDTLKPKFDKINPISGFKRIFSMRSVVETLKAILKMSIVGYIVYKVIQDRYHELATSVLMDHQAMATLFASTAWEIAIRSVMALLVFGAIDYFYQRWEYERGLKMTKQEIKDEAKQSEGDPMVKGRIRRAQREAARRRMMSEVPKATVVITNPTHFAVALKYDRDSMDAPRVVAKGMDLVAQRIKEIAAENDVPMVENVPLARALYKKVEIDEIIPEELYAAVAEILVLVQRLNAKKQKAR